MAGIIYLYDNMTFTVFDNGVANFAYKMGSISFMNTMLLSLFIDLLPDWEWHWTVRRVVRKFQFCPHLGGRSGRTIARVSDIVDTHEISSTPCFWYYLWFRTKFWSRHRRRPQWAWIHVGSYWRSGARSSLAHGTFLSYIANQDILGKNVLLCQDLDVIAMISSGAWNNGCLYVQLRLTACTQGIIPCTCYPLAQK